MSCCLQANTGRSAQHLCLSDYPASANGFLAGRSRRQIMETSLRRIGGEVDFF
jgi:hypothetical protein